MRAILITLAAAMTATISGCLGRPPSPLAVVE